MKIYIISIAIMSMFLFFGILSCSENDDDDSSNSDDDTTNEAPIGTWIDSEAGLMWEKEIAENSEYLYDQWEESVDYCETLELGGYTDWRLPTISELRSLVRGCEATMTGGACGVTDACISADCENTACEGCNPLQGPGGNGGYWPADLTDEPGLFWSATEYQEDVDLVWVIDYEGGSITELDKENSLDISAATRCVRTMTAE